MPETSTWSKVFVGCDLLIKGEVWTVTATQNVKDQARKITAQKVGTSREHTSQPNPDGEVLVQSWPAPAIPGTPPEELATHVVQATLGGEVLSQSRGAEDPFPRCPRAFTSTGALQAHLYVFHGVRSWDLAKDWDGATALHAHLHESIRTGTDGQDPSLYRDHTHDL
jgi:hypothetical protein